MPALDPARPRCDGGHEPNLPVLATSLPECGAQVVCGGVALRCQRLRGHLRSGSMHRWTFSADRTGPCVCWSEEMTEVLILR